MSESTVDTLTMILDGKPARIVRMMADGGALAVPDEAMARLRREAEDRYLGHATDMEWQHAARLLLDRVPDYDHS